MSENYVETIRRILDGGAPLVFRMICQKIADRKESGTTAHADVADSLARMISSQEIKVEDHGSFVHYRLPNKEREDIPIPISELDELVKSSMVPGVIYDFETLAETVCSRTEESFGSAIRIFESLLRLYENGDIAIDTSEDPAGYRLTPCREPTDEEMEAARAKMFKSSGEPIDASFGLIDVGDVFTVTDCDHELAPAFSIVGENADTFWVRRVSEGAAIQVPRDPFLEDIASGLFVRFKRSDPPTLREFVENVEIAIKVIRVKVEFDGSWPTREIKRAIIFLESMVKSYRRAVADGRL